MAKIATDVHWILNLDFPSKSANPKSIQKKHNIEISFEKTLNDLQKTWTANAAKTKELVPQIPAEYRPMFELQQSIYKCHLQTEIITKVGDSVQSTLKKLQNQGG